MAQEYNVVIFDKPGAQRQEFRPLHVQGIAPAVQAGIIKSVGAIYKDDAKTQFAGSALQVVADSKEEVVEILKQDIYYEKGIWDIDSAIVNPIGLAVRLPVKLPGTDDKFYHV